MSEYRHWSTGVEVQTPQYSQGFQVKEFVELPRFGGRGDGGDTGPDGFDAARGIEDDVFAVAFVIAHFAQVEADQEQVNLTQFAQLPVPPGQRYFLCL